MKRNGGSRIFFESSLGHILFEFLLASTGISCWDHSHVLSCGYINVIGTPHQIDGWNPTHKNGDEWGMVYDIAIPVNYYRLWRSNVINLWIIPNRIMD